MKPWPSALPNTPRASPPNAIAMALPLSLSSGYRSANIPIPAKRILSNLVMCIITHDHFNVDINTFVNVN